MVKDVDPILKALTDGSVGAGMGANTNPFGMSGFNTSSDKFVGESRNLSPEVLENFITAHR